MQPQTGAGKKQIPFEVAALNGPKYDIEVDKLFWFAYNDAKETYELHIR